MSQTRRYRKETLEGWKVAVLGVIVLLCGGSGFLFPIVKNSYLYDTLRFWAGVFISLLVTAWCLIDAKVERYDIDQDRPWVTTLLYWVPLVGVIYYFVQLRGLRGGAPLIAKALLFTVLMGALFVTTREFSRNVLSNF